MDFIIPYTKEITFDTKIAQVDSISLEHEMNINDSEILGNFIVTGEYKTHELSANKESFEHTIPFSIDIPDNIDKDTIDFEITDFTYEIEKDNILKVIIEVNLKAKELKTEERDIIEEQLEKEEEIFESPEKIDTEIIDEIEEIPIKENREEQIQPNNQETKDDEYITYHVHIYKENENLEDVCKKYNSNLNILKDYNDITNLKTNDKLIIPEEDE